MYYSGRHIATNSPQNISPHFKHMYLFILAALASSAGILSWYLYKVWFKNTVKVATNCHPVESRLIKTLQGVLIHLSHRMCRHDTFGSSSKWKGPGPWKVAVWTDQGIKVAVTVQPMTCMKEDLQSCFRKWQGPCSRCSKRGRRFRRWIMAVCLLL